jgi:hypothetical protein
MKIPLVPLFLVIAGLAADWSLGQERAITAEQLAFFESRIQPVLAKHCYACHSSEAAKANKLKAGLLLDSRDGVLKGGESGSPISPGKPADSILISAIRYQDLEMPPAGKLPDEVIADFVRWVEMGAPDPRQTGESVEETLRRRAAAHWAYHAPQKSPIPTVRDASWPRNAAK